MAGPIRFRPNLPLSIVVVFWAFNFVAVKVVYREMTAPVLALVRYFLMWALLVLVCRIRKESLAVEKEDRIRVYLNGFLSMGLYMVLFLGGMANTTASEGAIIMATSPLFTYLLSVIFRWERFRWLALTGSFIAFGGVVMIVAEGNHKGHGTLVGNLMVLAAALAWAISTAFMKPIVTKYRPLPVFTASLPGALPAMLIYGIVPTIHQDFAAISPYGWLMFGHVAILSGVVAFVCFYEGVRQIGPSASTTYQFLVPPVAALFAVLILGDSLLPLQYAGMVIVLAGVFLASWARRQPAT